MLPGLAVACPVGCWMTGVGAVEPGAAVRGVVAEGVAGASVVAPGVPAQQEALVEHSGSSAGTLEYAALCACVHASATGC